MLMEAGDEATRLREEAEIEASRRRADAANDAEAELSMAKQQGREMVNEARAYRERVLSELARRRELAREQIEQLVHGRDRLMQAFERARLVAVDVVAEMQPLGEPDEYVNLQPSTGPVPVMVAREEMAPTGREVADDAAEPVDGELESDTAVTGDESVRQIYDGAAETELDADEAVDAHAAETEIDETVVDETDAGEAVVEEADADAAEIETDVAEDESPIDLDAGSVDDVVVDLFARLRATNDDETEVEVAAETPESDEIAGEDESGGVPATDDAEEASDEVVEATPFDQRDADLTPLIVASARKLKRVLADEQNEVLDALRRNDPVRDLDALLPWTSHHAERYSVVLGDELLAAANAGAALTAANGRTPRLRKAAARQAVQQASETLTRSLVSPLRDRLERCIAEGDGDNPTITKKVRAVYREWKTQHIDEQLDDVFRAAHGRGVLAAVEVGYAVRVDARSEPRRVP